MRLVLETAAYHSEAYKSLNLHINNKSTAIIAKNMLIAHIISSPSFNPEEPVDIQYLWSVWYDVQWDLHTTKRFLNNMDQLLSNHRSNSIHSNSTDFAQLCKVWNSWKLSASEMNLETLNNILLQRYIYHDTHIYSPFLIYLIMSNFRVRYITLPWQSMASDADTNADPFSLLAELTPKIIVPLQFKLQFNDWKNTSKCKSFKDELANYLKTGNCSPMPKKTVCINPTLFQADTNQWLVYGLSNPFESYLPFPYEKLMSTDRPRKTRKFPLFHHCLAVLKDQIVQYRLRMDNISFSFYLGDCLMHSILNPHWKNRFTVVHTSHLADIVGLANLLPSVSNCLAKDDPYALIVTNSSNSYYFKSGSVAEYIEASLRCPLTLIPTIYGLRLMDHILLGSSVPVTFSKSFAAPTCLKWQRSPSIYSDNVNLEISPPLPNCLTDICNMCFFESRGVGTNPDVFRTGLIHCTPMTYNYIIQSLRSRSSFLEMDDRYFLCPDVPEKLELAWQTQKLWMNGEKVLQYERTSTFKLDSPDIRLADRPVKLILIPGHQIQKFADVHQEIVANDGVVKLPTPESFIKGCHYVENIHLSYSRDDTHEKVYVSFLLDSNHNLEDSYYVCLVDALYSLPIFSFGRLSLFKKMMTRNPKPFGIDSRSVSSSAPDSLVQISCFETEDSYNFSIIDPNSDFQTDRKLSTH